MKVSEFIAELSKLPQDMEVATQRGLLHPWLASGLLRHSLTHGDRVWWMDGDGRWTGVTNDVVGLPAGKGVEPIWLASVTRDTDGEPVSVLLSQLHSATEDLPAQ